MENSEENTWREIPKGNLCEIIAEFRRKCLQHLLDKSGGNSCRILRGILEKNPWGIRGESRKEFLKNFKGHSWRILKWIIGKVQREFSKNFGENSWELEWESTRIPKEFLENFHYKLSSIFAGTPEAPLEKTGKNGIPKYLKEFKIYGFLDEFLSKFIKGFLREL